MKQTEFIVENSIIAQEADDMHRDHEVQMARSQLYSAAQAAIQIHKLLKNVSEMEGLEGWVQTKIAVASEYLESVQDYLKYEAVSQEPEMMPFAEAAANYALNRLVEAASPGSDAWLRQKTSGLSVDTTDPDTLDSKEPSPGSDLWLRQKTASQPSVSAPSSPEPSPAEVPSKPGETRYGPGYDPNAPNPVDVKPNPDRPKARVNAAGQRAFQNYLNTQGADLKLDGIVGPKTKAASDEYFAKLQASMPRSSVFSPDYDKKWEDYEQKRNMYMDMQAIAAAHHVKPAPGKPYTWLDSPNYREIFKKYNLDPTTGLPAKPKVKEQSPALPAEPTGHGQLTNKVLPGGQQVTFDPATGSKTSYGAQGTTTYDATGKAKEYTTPDLGGFAKRTDLGTGQTTTMVRTGDVAATSTPRQDQSTVKTASAPIGSATASMASGIGFGGAGKDVQQGGNQVVSITNPAGKTQSFAGRVPSSQEIGSSLNEKSKKLKETASAGGSSAGGIATSMSGPAHKRSSGVPKKLGNAHKPKKITVGKGVY